MMGDCPSCAGDGESYFISRSAVTGSLVLFDFRLHSLILS